MCMSVSDGKNGHTAWNTLTADSWVVDRLVQVRASGQYVACHSPVDGWAGHQHHKTWAVVELCRGPWTTSAHIGRHQLRRRVGQCVWLPVSRHPNSPVYHMFIPVPTHTYSTVGHKKHTKMCFTITFIKLGRFWRSLPDCFFLINFPQSSDNYHLTRVPSSHYLVKLESH